MEDLNWDHLFICLSHLFFCHCAPGIIMGVGETIVKKNGKMPGSFAGWEDLGVIGNNQVSG